MLASYGIKEPILSAFENTPRELFVPLAHLPYAYEDRAVGIGLGQTTSQPSLIALILQSLYLKKSDIILEIGTGAGFQTALLTHLCREVVSIDRIDKFTQIARKNLKKLKINNITLLSGDGTQGFSPKAPYNTIIVSAADTKVPENLINQLAIGGKLIMPIGDSVNQELILFEKRGKGLVISKKISDVSFVPLITESEHKEK